MTRVRAMILCGFLSVGCTRLNSAPAVSDGAGPDVPAPTMDARAVSDGGLPADSASDRTDGHATPTDVPVDRALANDAVSDARIGADTAGEDTAVENDPCLSVACNVPPLPTCFNPTTQRRWAEIGSCANGTCTYQSQDTTCPFGCSNAKCNLDPCVGVTCNSPTANACEDVSHLRAYNTTGTCSGGTCTYASQLIPCACANNACAIDPCANVTCTTPPGTACSDANTLRTYAAAGTCTSGSCSYAASDTTCPFGCSGAACQSDPCAGVVCNSPPAAFCADTFTVRRYAAQGSCGAGLCEYAATDLACDNGCVSARCRIVVLPPCFPAGTPITMADLSSVPIEEVVVGDLVLAFDPITGLSAPGRVLKTFVHPYAAGSTLVRINGGLAATPEHPFFRNDAWAPAGWLGVGDQLLRVGLESGGEPSFVPAPVTSVRSERVESEIAVYNLEIDQLHDYFAGEMLVHNKPEIP